MITMGACRPCCGIAGTAMHAVRSAWLGGAPEGSQTRFSAVLRKGVDSYEYADSDYQDALPDEGSQDYTLRHIRLIHKK